MRRMMISVAAGIALAACGHGGADRVPASVTATSALEAESAVRDVLAVQTAAWNRGDIPAFMDHYWKSDELRFASGGTVTRGWQATLDRYLQRYSSREQMGQLTFSDLEVQQLAADAAIVHGRWKLARQSDVPAGLFTLVFRELGTGWMIVSDTTTSE